MNSRRNHGHTLHTPRNELPNCRIISTTELPQQPSVEDESANKCANSDCSTRGAVGEREYRVVYLVAGRVSIRTASDIPGQKKYRDSSSRVLSLPVWPARGEA